MNNGYGPAKVATRGRVANYQCDNDPQAAGDADRKEGC